MSALGLNRDPELASGLSRLERSIHNAKVGSSILPSDTVS